MSPKKKPSIKKWLQNKVCNIDHLKYYNVLIFIKQCKIYSLYCVLRLRMHLLEKGIVYYLCVTMYIYILYIMYYRVFL